MFVYNRSALTVILPLALLLAVALWSNSSEVGADKQAPNSASDRAPPEPEHDEVLLSASNGSPARGR